MNEEARLAGTWCLLMNEPGNEHLLHFTGKGRAVEFTYGHSAPAPNDINPRFTMRWRYSFDSPGILRIHPRPGNEGWSRTYRFDGETLIITDCKRDWIFQKAMPDRIPAWYPAALAQALENMPAL